MRSLARPRRSAGRGRRRGGLVPADDQVSPRSHGRVHGDRRARDVVGELERGEVVITIAAVLVGFGAAALFWQLRYLSVTDTIDGMHIGSTRPAARSTARPRCSGRRDRDGHPRGLLAVIVFVGHRVARRRPRRLVTLGVAAAIGAVWLANLVLEATRRSAAVALLVPCALAFGAFLRGTDGDRAVARPRSVARPAWLAAGRYCCCPAAVLVRNGQSAAQRRHPGDGGVAHPPGARRRGPPRGPSDADARSVPAVDGGHDVMSPRSPAWR